MKRLDLLEQAHAARAEVLAMIAAWRVSVGAGPDATPPEELRACLAAAEEEVSIAEDVASGDFAPDAEMLEERRAAMAEHGELRCSLAPAGGHYGDA